MSANRVELPPSVCWNSRRPVPAVALVNGAGPVIVNTIAESSPEFADVSRTLTWPGPEGPVESPQLSPTTTIATHSAEPKSRDIAGFLRSATLAARPHSVPLQ